MRGERDSLGIECALLRAERDQLRGIRDTLEAERNAANARSEAKTTVSEMADFPRPWRVEHSRRRHARGGYSRCIRAANDAYIAERVNYDGLAEYIVAAVNERDDLLAQLAAATARAEAAEATIELRDEQLVVARDVEKYLRRHIETAERERDEWQRRAEQWKARWEHDSPDAYNARINEAMRHLTQQSEAHL